MLPFGWCESLAFMLVGTVLKLELDAVIATIAIEGGSGVR